MICTEMISNWRIYGGHLCLSSQTNTPVSDVLLALAGVSPALRLAAVVSDHSSSIF
jgi:hypothetical protein